MFFPKFVYMAKNTPFFPILHIFVPLNDVRVLCLVLKNNPIYVNFWTSLIPPWHSSAPPRPLPHAYTVAMIGWGYILFINLKIGVKPWIGLQRNVLNMQTDFELLRDSLELTQPDSAYHHVSATKSYLYFGHFCKRCHFMFTFLIAFRCLVLS